MELLERVEAEIKKTQEKLETKKHSLTPYKPKSKTINNIKELNKDTTAMAYYFLNLNINRLTATMYSDYLENQLTGIKVENLFRMDKNSKSKIKEIFDDLIKDFDKINPKYYHSFFSSKVKPISERIRYITNGVNIDKYTFLSREKETEVIKILKSIMKETVDIFFGKNEKDSLAKIADNILKYFLFQYQIEEHDAYTTGLIKKMFHLSCIKNATDDEEERRHLKNVFKNFFQKEKKLNLIQFNLLKSDLVFANNFYYLFENNEVNEIKDFYLEKIEIVFEELAENPFEKYKLNKLNEIKTKIEEINKWN